MPFATALAFHLFWTARKDRSEKRARRWNLWAKNVPQKAKRQKLAALRQFAVLRFLSPIFLTPKASMRRRGSGEP